MGDSRAAEGSWMVTIYLSGGIKDLTDEQAYGWRKGVVEHYKGYDVRILVPTRLQYRPDMDIHAACLWLTKRDKVAILDSDIVLAYCPRPSWGTAMEIIYAQEHGKWVITVCDDPEPSPWLMAHSDAIVGTFKEAYSEVKKVIKDMEVLLG